MTPREALKLLLETKSQREVAEALSDMGLPITQPALSIFLNTDSANVRWDVGEALILMAKKEKSRRNRRKR